MRVAKPMWPVLPVMRIRSEGMMVLWELDEEAKEAETVVSMECSPFRAVDYYIPIPDL